MKNHESRLNVVDIVDGVYSSAKLFQGKCDNRYSGQQRWHSLVRLKYLEPKIKIPAEGILVLSYGVVL